MRPFDEKWKDHRLHDKVDSYHSTIEFLYKSVEDNTNDNDLSDSDNTSGDDFLCQSSKDAIGSKFPDKLGW